MESSRATITATGPVPRGDPPAKPNWFRRIGLLAFLFFLGKGLFWLALLIAALYFR
jgi:hypothetical protein